MLTRCSGPSSLANLVFTAILFLIPIFEREVLVAGSDDADLVRVFWIRLVAEIKTDLHFSLLGHIQGMPQGSPRRARTSLGAWLDRIDLMVSLFNPIDRQPFRRLGNAV